VQSGGLACFQGSNAFRQAGVTFVGFPPYKRNDRGGLSFSVLATIGDVSG